jgi:ATP-dependent RNA helicase RhlE
LDFKTFNFHPSVAAGITAAGFKKPTPIQAKAIIPLMKGLDVMGLAQTGTANTAAFALQLINLLI